MGEPITTAAILAKAGATLFKGLGDMSTANQKARAIREDAEWAAAEQDAQAQIERQNAEIAATRAFQTDAAARQGLESEIASMRAVMGANQTGGGVPMLDILSDVRDMRNRDKRIRVQNENLRGLDHRMRAAVAGMRGRAALARGAANARATTTGGRNSMFGSMFDAGTSLFSLLD